MGCCSDFFKGYKRTPRQECKIRASTVHSTDNQNNDEYWKNREDYLEPVPSVSFSFGQGKDRDEMLSQEIPGADGYGPVKTNEHENLYPTAGGIATFEENASTLSRKSINSYQSGDTSKSGKSHSKVENSRASADRSSGHLKENESGVVHKEGDIEWMYQLNALAKEHAKRNKGQDLN